MIWFAINAVLAALNALAAIYGPLPAVAWFGCSACLVGAIAALISIRRPAPPLAKASKRPDYSRFA